MLMRASDPAATGYFGDDRLGLTHPGWGSVGHFGGYCESGGCREIEDQRWREPKQTSLGNNWKSALSEQQTLL